MGYQALLFCPDEKTARTVTQVLNELEFNVEPCIEPFAAVKKLMGEHFDAVVVDCDNEQNATLLFKSARNSTSNQTSLAVAVVEGQAGVAKAFRIGANLVLTKPINIEQAKGTLRVARGLLRKGEPAKPGATAAAAAPQAVAPAPAKPAPKPVSAAKPVAPVPQAAPAAREIPAAKPASTPAWPAAAAATTAQAPKPGNLPPIPKAAPAPAVPSIPEPPAPKVEAPSFAKAPEAPVVAQALPTSAYSGSGAASAAAPAREPQVSQAPEVPVANAIETPKATASAAAEPGGIVGAAPTFSFGGSAEPATSGGNKKIFIGVAAAVVITAAAYFGWVSKSHNSGTSATPAATTQSASATPQGIRPTVEQSSGPGATGSVENATGSALSNIASAESAPAAREAVSKPTASSTKGSTSSAPVKSAAKEKAAPEEAPEESDAAPEAAPLMVKGGKAPEKPKSAAAEVSAPSMIGMATPASAPPPDLVPTTTSEFKPKLQMMSVSQGVSQGLLYKKISPVYPPNALRLRIEGTVELMATISKSGDITQVKVVSGDSQLSKAAADAVKQWKYKPYLLNGEPVEIQTQVTIKFKLPN
jgi:TonB family protein